MRGIVGEEIIMKVLIVDDKEENIYMLETLLKGNGYEVISARNGIEAIEKLKISPVDLIISDVLMPKMDGFQLCRTVKSDNTLNRLPFIFYTASYTDAKDEELAYKCGADKYVRKPVEPDEFIMIVKDIIRDVHEGKIAIRKPVSEEKEEVQKLYSERLIAKLEQKRIELQEEIDERKKVEVVLRQSENKYRTLLENLPQKIFLKDSKSVYISCNENYARDLRIKSDEIAGKTDYDFYPEESAEKYRADDKRIGESGITEEIDEEYIEDGKKAIVHTIKVPVKDEKGNIVGILGIFWDITEQKKADETLRKRKEQIILFQNALLELAKMDLSDLDSSLREITEADAKTIGVERVSIWFYNEDLSEIICQTLYKMSEGIHAKGLRLRALDYPRYFEAIERSRIINANDACTDLRTSEFSEGYLKPLGITSMMDVPVRLRGNMVGVLCHEHVGPMREWTIEEQDFAASISDFVSLALETSERRKVEEALQRSQVRYMDLFENANDMIFTLDLDANFTSVNKAACSASGYTKEELIGKNLQQILTNEGFKFASEMLQQAIVQKEDLTEFQPWEMEIITKTGNKIIVEVNARLIREDDQLIGVHGMARDITQRKKMEKEIQKRIKELEEFYEIAVRRELRMKELKEDTERLQDEINRLKGQNKK